VKHGAVPRPLATYQRINVTPACETERVTTAPPTGEEMVAALRSLYEQFLAAASSGPLVTVDSFLHDGGTAAEVSEMLSCDPVIAGYLAIERPMLTIPSSGSGYELRSSIGAFLRELAVSSLPFDDEAVRFLGAMRVMDDVVPARVQVAIVGISVEERVALPFGSLMPATPNALALPEGEGEPPPFALFEFVVDVPAAVVGVNARPWTASEFEDKDGVFRELVEEPLGRLMVSLALGYANPVQERVFWLAPLYSDSRVSRDAIPIGPAWSGSLRHRYPKLEVDRLCRDAEIVACAPDVSRLALAAQRYFQAIAERIRPADKLIDYVIAIEAITRTSDGKEQCERLVALIGDGIPDSGVDNRADFKLVKDTRNDIVHGKRPPRNVASIANVAQRLVDHAITAAVRKDVAAVKRAAASCSAR
jgi:hypothetical protein